MQWPRFWIFEQHSYWHVRDRSGVIEEKSYKNPADAQYVCDGLNFYHHAKTKRYENAA